MINRFMSNLSTSADFNRTVLKRYRNELAGWLGRQDFNIGLTLNFNRRMGLTHARKQVGDLFFWVDRHLGGPRFQKRPERRIGGVFFFEHLDTNIHCHGLIKVPEGSLPKFAVLFPGDRNGLWSDVCPSGSHFVSTGTMQAAANYDSKDQKPWSDPTTMLWLSEFYPNQ